MKKVIEEFWSEYFFEKCAAIDSVEEKELIKKAAELHKNINRSMTEEQNAILEKYIEVLYKMQALFCKKTFFKGCEFAISFLLETENIR